MTKYSKIFAIAGSMHGATTALRKSTLQAFEDRLGMFIMTLLIHALNAYLWLPFQLCFAYHGLRTANLPLNSSEWTLPCLGSQPEGRNAKAC